MSSNEILQVEVDQHSDTSLFLSLRRGLLVIADDHASMAAMLLPGERSTGTGVFDASPASSTSREKGLAFEEQVVTLMQSLNCELRATQQSRDGGIDHQGSWTLPDLEVEVVTQCKNERKPVGVHYVREFHGVLNFFPPTTVGLFASASGYSIYAQRFFLRMTHPAILCTVDTDSGRLTSFLLNDRAQTLLHKLTVGSLFVDQEHALVLTYGDRSIQVDPPASESSSA
ncbi:hypothetical protein PF008_g8594 [Phytophthora fragariae]|uniref:Restriction endonuclease type IV Mrr domain-containing protein n=1 Tax=Phytophthora fragariae TaxID=53985 RepID=A0A6G0RZA4_9STRA|nr:hypothetical protein PF008_g8594 [Phytophthora fragariae]